LEKGGGGRRAEEEGGGGRRRREEGGGGRRMEEEGARAVKPGKTDFFCFELFVSERVLVCPESV
jgi:hypothetical protein